MRFWLCIASLLLAGPCLATPVEKAVAGQVRPAITALPVDRPDIWWQARHAACLSRVQAVRPVVVFIGDSITQGWEGPGRGVWERNFAPLRAVNLGFSGDRTQHVLWRLGAGREMEGLNPRAVVLMIGTNNSVADSASEIAIGIEAIVKLIRQQHPQTKVLLLGVFPRGEKPDNAERLKLAAVNEKIRHLDDGKWVIFRDIGVKFLNKDGTLSSTVMPDYLHLSEQGYTIWAEALEGVLKAMLAAP